MNDGQDMEQIVDRIWEEKQLTCDLLDSTFHETPERWRGIALGFFDGVHRGHQELLNALMHHCRRLSYEPSVFSFYRMPQKESFDTAERQYTGMIQVPEKRAAFLARYGIKQTWLQVFNDRFKALSADEFLDRILYDRLGVRLVVIGDDFRFGKDRQGDAAFLSAWGERRGVEVIVVPSVVANHEVVSSTRIKEAIIAGKFREVSRFLGHEYSMTGPVIRGNALGRTVGMPTANVAVPEGQLCPPYGVYITRTRVGDRMYPSVSNIGTRPTVNKKDYIPLLETCLLNMDINLYGQEIEVYFLDYIRPELTFSSFLSMTASIAKDIEYANQWHRSNEELVLVSRFNRVPVYTLAANRFNSSIINVVIKDQLHPRRSAANALAARMISTASEQYPSRSALQLAADNLYGASLASQVTRQGNLQVIWFYADGIRQAIDGSEPFSDVVDILLDLLQRPLLDADNLLDADLFKTEQKNLVAELKARRQDKAWYALNRSVNLWTEGEPQAIPAGGEADVVADLSREEVTEAWFRLLGEAHLQIFLAGDIASPLLEKVIAYTQTLPLNPHRLNVVAGVDPAPVDLPVKVAATEYMDIEQARLVMIYKGLPPYNFNQQALISVFNSMFGGDAHSLLFNTIREDNGLAYQISSMTLRFLSALVIQAGVSAEAIDQVLTMVRSTLEEMASGKGLDRTFTTSKNLLRNELLSISDNLSAILFFHMENLASGSRLTLAEALEDLERVTIEQVQALAATIEEAFFFRLLPSAADDAAMDAPGISLEKEV